METASRIVESFGWVVLSLVVVCLVVQAWLRLKERCFRQPVSIQLKLARQEGRCDERDKIVRLLEHEAESCQDAAIAVLFQTAANRIDYPDRHCAMSIYDLWQSKLQADAEKCPPIKHVAVDALFHG